MADGLKGLARAIGEGGLAFTTGTPLPQVQQQMAEHRLGIQTSRDQARLNSLASGAIQLKQLQSPEAKMEYLVNRKAELQSAGLSTEDTDEAIQMLQAGDLEGLERVTDMAIQVGERMRRGGGASARAFAPQTISRDGGLFSRSLVFDPATQDFTVKETPIEGDLVTSTGETIEQKREAEIAAAQAAEKAKVLGKVTGESETAETAAETQAVIREREKFAEMTGASRAKAIDSGFEKIQKIDQGIGNINRAITALEGGAKTGAVERFWPSIRSATVELNNIQKSMALDVIGSVTFGALSKGELDLAKDVALPTGLNEKELLDHLRKRLVAQQKLKSYFQEQVNFLDQGGTIAGFLRMKKRQEQSKPSRSKGKVMTDANGNRGEGKVMTDANGNRAIVYPDGSFEEL